MKNVSFYLRSIQFWIILKINILYLVYVIACISVTDNNYSRNSIYKILNSQKYFPFFNQVAL